MIKFYVLLFKLYGNTLTELKCLLEIIERSVELKV
jgi:hypothetical protein